MAYSICKIKNLKGTINTLHGHEFQINEVYAIPDELRLSWASSDAVLDAITADDYEIHDSTGAVSGYNLQIDYLKDKSPQEVIPMAPKNEYGLRPYGMVHAHIDSSDQIYDITLSNKSGKDIDYSDCTTTPQFYDCIFQDHSVVRDGVMSVDGSTITTFNGALSNGDAEIVRPFNIDYKISTMEEVTFIYLWGLFINAEGFGEDDIGRLQVCDPDEVGVALGLYTSEQIQAMGYIVKEYDECWIKSVNEVVSIGPPNNTPAEIINGFVLRVKYYCKDWTKTDVKVWLDYKVTLKDQ